LNNIIICRCEEVTEEEIREAILSGCTTVNEIKRKTRAGMGLCQGRTCRKLVEKVFADETGIEMEKIQPSTYRSPVRPVPISNFEEDDN